MSRNKNKKRSKYNKNKQIGLLRKKLKTSQAKKDIQMELSSLKRSMKFDEILKFIALVLLFVLIIYGIYTSGSIKFETSLRRVVSRFLIYFGGAIPALLSAKMNRDVKGITIKQENVNLIRHIWRKRYYLHFLSYLLLLIGFSLTDSMQNNPNSLYLSVVFSMTLTLIFNGIVIVGFMKPQIILNRWILAVADGIKMTLIVPTMWILISLFRPNLFDDWIFIFFHFLFVIGLYYLYFLLFNKFKYSDLEDRVIRHAEVTKIKLSLSIYTQNLFAKKKAKRDFENYLAKGDFHYIQALAENIRNYNGDPMLGKWVKYAVIAFITFLLTSVGEGLVQDSINEPLKEFLCDFLSLFC